MTPLEFVIHVENTLGWTPTDRPRARNVEAMKLKRKMAENPVLYTWDNLLLAVELLRREKARVKSPVGVCWHVTRALAQTHREVVTDVAQAVQNALQEAYTAGERGWVSKLSRARGEARRDVVDAWTAYRRGR